jgi:predicted outer membrane repeat protein
MKTPRNSIISIGIAAWLILQAAFSPLWSGVQAQKGPDLPAVDRTVGPGCTYPTIAAALAAASPSDKLLLAGGVTFNERLTLTRSVTIQGGYNQCTGASSANSTIDGGSAGVVLTIAPGLSVTLTNLNVIHGSGTNGGGIQVGAANPTPTTLTLTNVAVSNNSASQGAGIWLGKGTVLNGTNVTLASNTATAQGGGIAGSGAVTITLTNPKLQNNTAGTDGGAAYINDGTLDFAGQWDVSHNSAGGSGGAVAVDGLGSTRFLANGTGDSQLAFNQAGLNGGALNTNNNNTIQMYAAYGFAISLSNNSAVGSGGAVYANAGAFFDVWGKFRASANQAGGDGGVWYLGTGSSIWMDSFGADGPQILANKAHNGGVIFASASPRVECDNTVFGTLGNGNQATTGNGGVLWLDTSSFSANNCTFQYNNAALNGGAVAATGSTLAIGVTYTITPAEASASSHPQAAQLANALGCSAPVRHECSSFHDNQADSNAQGTGSGGAVYAVDSTTRIDLTYLHDNGAVDGAAISSTGNSTTVQNSLIHHNHATATMGAALRSESGTFKINQVTVVDNTGVGFSGAAAANTSAVNSISWGNSAGGYAGIGGITCSIGTVGGLNADPLFYASNDFRPWRGSPAIDACTSGLSNDLNNYSRPFNKLYDMGAFEFAYKLVFIPSIRK